MQLLPQRQRLASSSHESGLDAVRTRLATALEMLPVAEIAEHWGHASRFADGDPALTEFCPDLSVERQREVIREHADDSYFCIVGEIWAQRPHVLLAVCHEHWRRAGASSLASANEA